MLLVVELTLLKINNQNKSAYRVMLNISQLLILFPKNHDRYSWKNM